MDSMRIFWDQSGEHVFMLCDSSTGATWLLLPFLLKIKWLWSALLMYEVRESTSVSFRDALQMPVRIFSWLSDQRTQPTSCELMRTLAQLWGCVLMAYLTLYRPLGYLLGLPPHPWILHLAVFFLTDYFSYDGMGQSHEFGLSFFP